MQINVGWSDLKAFSTARSLSIQWLLTNNVYYLSAIDGPVELSAVIPYISPAPSGSDQADFETNYKSNGNKPLPIQSNPFAAKVLPDGKSLYKRFTGISQTLILGSNTFTWTQASFPWTKFVGVEIIGGELGDTCSLYVLDTSTGTYSGTANATLNQFAYTANIAPGFYNHTSSYDADLYQNLQIKFVYTSISNKTIYINFDMNEVK